MCNMLINKEYHRCLLDFCGSLWFVDEGAPSSVLSLTFELVSLNSRRDLVIGDL